ncbi:dTDP-glucose 4,6-dehydratase [Streptomyces sp. NPDC101132]|uniref:dTDP-glucose 4,6-dehydratase n=1 Tax=Streptomyces sp. NPDC101132 TaxID=3366110 RepID=UPI0037FDC0C1
MNLLITGGAGFIGSHFTAFALGGGPHFTQDVRVTVLDSLTRSGNAANLDSVATDQRFRFVHGDIRDARLVDRVVQGHDAVVHFAAETHVDRSITSAGPFVATNVVGTQVLLDAALRHSVGRFVHVSTDEVYGSISDGSWSESSPLKPNSPYAASKASADLLALSYQRTHGLDVVVSRSSNTYGSRQFPEKLIPLFLTNLMEGLSVPLYGSGQNVRDWLHVSDHCRAIALILHCGRSGEVYNVGGGTELTNEDVTARLLSACDAGWDMVDRVPDRKGHDLRYSLDTRKIAAELGYAPQRKFDEAIEETIRWYRDNRSWWYPLKAAAALT